MALQLLLALQCLYLVHARDWKPSERAFTREQSKLSLEELLGTKTGRPSIHTVDDWPSSDHPQAFIKATPDKISDFGSVSLSISFKNYVPMPEDFVTVSCGEQSGGLNDYLDAVTLQDSTNIPVTIKLTELVFMRCDYTFTFVATTYYPSLEHFAIGNITVPMDEAPSTPKQGHLSYVGSPDTMAVQFVSASKSTPKVKYGTSPASLNMITTGDSKTYSASDLCEAPANQSSQLWFRDPGYVHTVKLTGLVPDQRYWYSFGNEEDGWSKMASFRAAPSKPRRTRFIAFGDQDVIEPSRNVSLGIVHSAKADKLDFVVHFGDLGYALGNHWLWDKWGTIMSWGASLAPYMVSPGNHEYDFTTSSRSSFVPSWWENGAHASHGECGVPLAARHTAPPNGDSVFYYSFTYGNVFVVQLSSEHDWTTGSKQWLWLKSQLQAVDRSTTPWVVVTSHRPIYSTQECETGDYVVSLHMREALDPLFDEYKVDLALVAHTHAYERTCPLRGGLCVPDGQGTVHITVGSAGAGLEGCGYSPRYGNFSRSHLNGWGYLEVDADVQSMELRMVLTSNYTVFDRYVLKRRVAEASFSI